MLPSPDLSVDSRCYVAGLRPWRDESYRLEKTTLGPKTLIHNYGHGGAGISMSWGCAEEVRGMIVSTGHPPGSTEVAVLGGGVMGLTAATLLREAGYHVNLYAKAFGVCTTSGVAGGQWAPSFINHLPTPAGKAEFDRIQRQAYRAHESRIDQGFGVYRRDNYTEAKSPTFEKVPRDLIPEPESLAHLPFEHLNRPGFCYKTLMIEPPVFLRRLQADLFAAGVGLVQKEFQDTSEIAALAEPVVVNCTGLGSRKLWTDALLKPLKGQLVWLPPQKNLEYLFSLKGYLFPRSDVVIVGGTQEWVDNPDPDPAMCHQLLVTMKNVFDGNVVDKALLPPWFIVDK